MTYTDALWCLAGLFGAVVLACIYTLATERPSGWLDERTETWHG